MGWTNHRMLRYLSSMGAITSSLSEFAAAWTGPQPGDLPYSELSSETSGPAARVFRMDDDARARVHDLAAATSALGSGLAGCSDLETHLPKPAPHFVMRGSLKI
jgi:hypothetical protein